MWGNLAAFLERLDDEWTSSLKVGTRLHFFLVHYITRAGRGDSVLFLQPTLRTSRRRASCCRRKQ